MTITGEADERTWLIERPRLLDRLTRSAARTVALVAPAGYGKSTLARQFVTSRAPQAVWHQCTGASTDVAALASDLAATVEQVTGVALGGVDDYLRTVLKPQQEGGAAADLFSEALSNWPQEVWMIIDDYEQVAGEVAAEDFLARIILAGRVPALVASRVRPAWLTPRRLAYGEVLVIDARELAMDASESAAVFEAVGRSPAPDLEALADGWPAALTLIALGGPNIHAVSGALEDFVAHEVYRSFDTDVRESLAVLSCLSTIEVRSAAIIVGEERARKCLRRARELGVLERITEERFELHPLVRDFLRSQPLDLEMRGVASAAGASLAEEGRWDDLFDLVDRLESEELLALLLTRGVRVALDEGRVTTARRWIDYARLHRMNNALVTLGEAELALRDGYFVQSETLGAEVAGKLEQYPAARTWALFVAGRAAHLAGREAHAVEYYRLARSGAGSDAERREAEWGELKAAIDLELPDAGELLQRLQESEQATVADRVEVASRSLILGARLGSLAALDEARSVLQLIDFVPDPVARASFRNTYAYACAIAGDYDEALAVLVDLEGEAQQQRLRFALPYVTCARAVVLTARRDFDAAFAALSEAAIEARRMSDSHVLGMCAAIKSRALIALGRFSEAASSAAYRHDSLIKSMHGELLVTRALAFACEGEDPAVHVLLADATAMTSAVEVLGIAKCVDAIVQARRNESSADQAAQEAATYAQDSRYVDGLITAYRGYPELARRVAACEAHTEWFAGVMERACDEQLARVVAGRRGAGAGYLSRREAEVFALLREGLSNKEIGSRLVISEETAKLHVYRIMRKLGARSRTEAALRAPWIG